MKSTVFTRLFYKLEGLIKYPYLKEGSIGIQVGFDMSSKNVSSDLFNMAQRVGPNGLTIGIDPDEENHRKAKDWMAKKGITNIMLIKSGTYKEKTELPIVLAKRTSHNTLAIYDGPKDSVLETITIPVDTLDNLISETGIDIQRIRHINITNNTAEYHTLLGMSNLLDEMKEASLSLTCGRSKSNNIIDGRPDQDLIVERLQSRGYQAKFFRMRELFWWGFVKKLLVKQVWVYDGKPRYGVVLAHKGNQPLKFFQSYMG